MVSGANNDLPRINQYNPPPPIAPSQPDTSSQPIETKEVTPPSGSAPVGHRGNDGQVIKNVSKEVELKGQVTFDQMGSAQKVSKPNELQLLNLETEDPFIMGAASGLSQEGKAAFDTGDFEGASVFYEAAFDFMPNASTAYNLGCCYQELGQTAQSGQLFETAQSLEPLNLQLKQKIENRLLTD